ncbi:MAG: L-lysine 6-transaminase [Planctomycetota bacterium]
MIQTDHVHDVLGRHQLVDGYPLVFDLDASRGVWLRDARTGDDYLDAFTCFASWPVGYNHPGLHDAAFETELLRSARTKLANSDLYTREMAGFVESFASCVTPKGFPHHFWVSGGALAVENALKAAFDWKARKLGRTRFEDDVNDLVVLHFEQAFHGRSGYTMSLTNTVPDKIGLFPKFDWPRVHNPAIEFGPAGEIVNDIEAEEARACREIEEAFARHKGKVAAILLEPMQGEGGDNHFRTEFLQKLRDYADSEEALLVFDEVQTGFFGTGKAWLWEHHGVAPDVVSFGKKTQICGIYASKRLDEVEDNVFRRSSRINSTWGGSLTDMVRCRRFIEIIGEEQLAERITATGVHVIDGLRSMAAERGGFSNVRGLGSLIAFTLETPEARDAMIRSLFEQKVMALSSGPRSIRFRLPLITTQAEADTLLERVAGAHPAAV